VNRDQRAVDINSHRTLSAVQYLPRLNITSVPIETRRCVGTRFKFMRERASHFIRSFERRNRSGFVLCTGFVFGERSLGGSFETKERERNGGCGREILPTNGFAQSLAFPSSFSANSYSARNLQLRMLRTAMRILYLRSLATE